MIITHSSQNHYLFDFHVLVSYNHSTLLFLLTYILNNFIIRFLNTFQFMFNNRATHSQHERFVSILYIDKVKTDVRGCTPKVLVLRQGQVDFLQVSVLPRMQTKHIFPPTTTISHTYIIGQMTIIWFLDMISLRRLCPNLAHNFVH